MEIEIKNFFVVATILSFLLVSTTSMARTDVSLNIGLGIPLPFFVAQVPVIAVPPPPVVVVPAPVVVSPPVFIQPAPVIIGHPGWYIGKHRGWYKHYR